MTTLFVSAIVASSCTFAEFELSPYAPRDVDVVYSEQEQLTFFVWRVDRETRFERVEFEIFVDGAYRTIDLDDTAFPHEPYHCDDDLYCVQFQLPGRWSPEPGTSAIRAHDERHGYFESSAPTIRHVEHTFSIDPLAIDNNETAMARLEDWFEEQEIPLRRDFQWGLTPGVEQGQSRCPDDPPLAWSPLADRVELPQGWIDFTPCFSVRPDQQRGTGAELRFPLIKAPMLHAQEVDREIPEITHPTLVTFLVDLEVLSEERCDRIVDAIRDTVVEQLDERDAPYQDLGIYRPTGDDGRETSGCNQSAVARYPVAELLLDADQSAASFSEHSTLVVVYLNNLELPPSATMEEDLATLFSAAAPGLNPHLDLWSIGSDEINFTLPWHRITPWAALEDQAFLSAIESTTRSAFPLRSTEFDGNEAIALTAPEASGGPQTFRICRFFPEPATVHIPPNPPTTYTTDTWSWPDQAAPRLFLSTEPQRFVDYNSFRDHDVRGVFEVCDAHCDNPFMGRDQTIRPSWLDAQGVCRWD